MNGSMTQTCIMPKLNFLDGKLYPNLEKFFIEDGHVV